MKNSLRESKGGSECEKKILGITPTCPLFHTGSSSLAFPLLPPPQDTRSLWIMCFYFVCTVFTTVGFGLLIT